MTTAAFVPPPLPPPSAGRPRFHHLWVAGRGGLSATRRLPLPARRPTIIISAAPTPPASPGPSSSSADDNSTSGDALAAEFAALVARAGAGGGAGASGSLSSAAGTPPPLTPEEVASVDAIESLGLAELDRLSATLQSSLAALDDAVTSGGTPDAATVNDLDPDAVIRGAAASSSALSASAARDMEALLARFDARKAALLDAVAADRAAIAEEVERLRELADGGGLDVADAAANADATKAARKRGVFRAAAGALAAAAVAYGVTGVAAATGAGGGAEELRNGAIDATVAALFAWLASREAPAAGEGEGGEGSDG